MSDNPQADLEGPFALPGHRIVAIEGPHAVAFCHAQFMNDVVALEPGHWHWNGWLTPKGRVIALFALLVTGAESILLVLPDADATEFVAQLKRFVFRSRVTISTRDALFANGCFRTSVAASGNRFSGNSADGTLELDVGGDLGPRTLQIAPAAVAADADHGARWAALDLTYGLPRLPASQVPQWTPQQLSLDRLHAYSVRKGCYPGQEIVARTHFLGQAKRGLALFESDAPVVAGRDVSDGDRSIGTVVSTAPRAGGTRLLAVLPLDRQDATLHVDGIPLRALTLADGLAR